RRSVWAGREAGGMPRGKSCERRRLDSPARSRLSPAEDRGARRSSQQALLLVVELDVRLVQQRDVLPFGLLKNEKLACQRCRSRSRAITCWPNWRVSKS